MVINSVLLLHTVVQSVLGNVQVPFFMRYSMKMCFFFPPVRDFSLSCNVQKTVNKYYHCVFNTIIQLLQHISQHVVHTHTHICFTF